MKLIAEANLITLHKSKYLLALLTNEQLANESVSPYYSSIGSHIRHILDFYYCIFNDLDSAEIDLTHRERDERMHHDCDYASCVLDKIILDFELLSGYQEDNILRVRDDLGTGTIKINYTLGALLAQANSHAIHHYAIINYILDRLGIIISDEDFGYNPSTPRIIAQN